MTSTPEAAASPAGTVDIRVRAAALVIFASSLGLGSVLPVFAFLVHDMGGDAIAVTYLVAVYSLANALAAPWMGRISDRAGRRLTILVVLAGSTLSYLGMMSATTLTTLFVFRGLCGAMSASEAVAQAFATDGRQSADHVRIMGTLTAVRGVGICLGPALAGLAGLLVTSRTDYYRLVFLCSMVVSAIAFAAAYLWLREAPTERQLAAAPAARGDSSDSRQRIRSYLFISTGIMLTFGTLMSVTNVYALHAFGWGPSEAGLLLSACSIVIIVARLRLSFLSRHIRTHRLIVCMSLLGSASMLAMALSRHPFVFAAFDMLFCAAYACAYLSATAEVSRLSDPMQRGRAIGWNHSLSSIALVTSAAAAGPLFEYAGHAVPYVVAAASLFCFAVAFLFLFHHLTKEESVHASR